MQKGSRRVFYSNSSFSIICISALLILSLFVGSGSGSALAFDHRHTAFTDELQKYVGMSSVDYGSWKKSPENLKRYIDSLTSIGEEEYKSFSEDEKKALWLNAYNALTIYLVLKYYPIKGNKAYYPESSIRQIDGFWEDNKITIGGKTATLAQIEHNLLRRDFCDPRTHFAVVPAAVGGATIERVAFSAPGLDQWLDRKAREYLGSPRNVRVDTRGGTIYVPQLFRWFPLDFAKSVGLGSAFPPPTDDQIIVAYLKKKGGSDLHAQIDRIGKKDAEIKVIYEPFDWTLNDLCPESPGATKKAASSQQSEVTSLVFRSFGMAMAEPAWDSDYSKVRGVSTSGSLNRPSSTPALYIFPRVLSVESVEKK